MWPRMHFLDLQQLDCWRNGCWEIEEKPLSDSTLSLEECTVVHHFRDNHSCTDSERFVVPLPKKPDTKPIGESRSQAVRRFLSLECSLRAKNQFDKF